MPGARSRNFGASLIQVDRQQEQRQHGRLRDVGRVHVAFDELRLVGDARFLPPACATAPPCPGCIRRRRARAPRLAAAMMLRPSPEPRSMTKSSGVTLAMSSILSTMAGGVGTHTTSLPAWPLTGSNGFCGLLGRERQPKNDKQSGRNKSLSFGSSRPSQVCQRSQSRHAAARCDRRAVCASGYSPAGWPRTDGTVRAGAERVDFDHHAVARDVGHQHGVGVRIARHVIQHHGHRRDP